MNTIPDCLRAWAPLIASGCQVPAASTIMYQAAELIEQQQAEIEEFKAQQRVPPAISPENISEDVCAKVQAESTLYDATPDCDGLIISANGGGVCCTKCSAWFCY